MDDIKKKPDADFVIRLDGPKIRPWAVSFRSLTRMLDAVQRLVDDKDEEEDGVECDEKDAAKLPDKIIQRALNLIDIKAGSAAYKVAGENGEEALRVLKETGRAMLRPERAGWSYSALQSIKELSETAKALDCKIEFRHPDKGKLRGDVIATIVPSTYRDISTSAYIVGETSIYGKIERVGGATAMHCGLRVHNKPRKMVVCRVVGTDLVRELGQYLYQYVFVTGKATWVRHNMQLRHFTITSFQPPKSGSVNDALIRIHEAGGGVWDDIVDVEARIDDMRGA